MCRKRIFGHRHSPDDVPILVVLEPCVGDADSVRLAVASLIEVFESDPIAGYADVAGYLNRGGLEIDEFESQTLVGLGGDPVRYVIFVDGSGADGGPPKKVRMPKRKIAREIVGFDVSKV